MEDIVQRVFAIIFAVLVFFLMPLYMTFEKRDDISYALALKITTNFVNTVKAKGYLTADMYTDFVSELGATDNTYEVKLQHVAKTYNPVINVYEIKTNKLIDTLDYKIYEEQFLKCLDGKQKQLVAKGFNGSSTYKTEDYKFELSYKAADIIYNEKQIMEFLGQEVSETKPKYFGLTTDQYKKIKQQNIPYKPVNFITEDKDPIYTMAVGDEFNVIIRNTNVTFATVMFDALTFSGMTSDVPRVYINYGGIIKNEEYKEIAM